MLVFVACKRDSQVLLRHSEVIPSTDLKKVAFFSCHALRSLRNLTWAVNNYVCTTKAKAPL